MQSPFEITEGLARLKSIIDEFPADSSHWNEAENRFQFVDRLLTECLGWERPNMRVEDSDEAGGRVDYILGNPPKAILEAKRESKSFGDIPIGKKTLVRKIDSLLHSSKNFKEAVHQVLQYNVLRGVPIAIVCNGPQLAIFQALTPGYPPTEGECYFFDGFSAYIENFATLWTLLSPEGITENRASRDLALYRNPRMPSKASEYIPDPMRFRYRSNFQQNLKELSALLLEEVEDNPALKSSFYRECYVPIKANNRHLLLSKRIISSRYRRVGDDGVVPASLDDATRTSADGEIIFQDATIKSSVSSRPIVVIGDVGVGKTSFFENLYEKIGQSDKLNTYFINVNLGIKANLSEDIKGYILSEIPSVLKRDYDINIDSDDFARAVYYLKLKEFDGSVEGRLKDIDPVSCEKERIKFLSELVSRRDTHLHASLGHLSQGRGKQIILVIDNADQRSFDVQQEAFLIAQELAATRNILVFVALRPSTFMLSKMTGALSGYQHKILTISPPPADEVVLRRLSFAVRVAKGEVELAALEGIRLQLGNVVSFLNATLRSVRTNQAIASFLSNVTGGNTRTIVELVTSFFGSPNVDSQKIVRIEQDQGNYKVPLHEFTKHALLGEYAYFNSHSSLVACNVFDVSTADFREHFLALLIISFLASNIGTRDNDGFVSGLFILQEMATNGYSVDQIRSSLRRLAAKRLIETPHSHFRELQVAASEPPEQFVFRATSSGVYHVRFWAGSFAFLDAVATDTPIFDEPTREEVARLASSFEIRDRWRKASIFKNYLDSQWHAASISASYFDFSSLLKSQVDSFESVRLAIDRGPANAAKWRSRR